MATFEDKIYKVNTLWEEQDIMRKILERDGRDVYTTTCKSLIFLDAEDLGYLADAGIELKGRVLRNDLKRA